MFEHDLPDDFRYTALIPAPFVQDHMPPSAGDAAQTPETKSTGGFASVFKSLTGNRSNRTPLAANNAALSNLPASLLVAQQLNNSGSTNAGVYVGPLAYEEFYGQLKNGRTLADRGSAAAALRLALSDYPLSGVINIWYAGKDLVDPKNPVDIRHAGFELLTACVKHGQSTDLERKEYFNTLTARLSPDDFHLQLAAIVELTKHGKDLSGFHYDVVPLLARWLHMVWDTVVEARKESKSAMSKPGQIKPPLGEETNFQQLFLFVVEVIKFGSVVAAEADTGHLIDEVIRISLAARFAEEIRGTVRVLDAIVIYSVIPAEKLPQCIKVLCSVYCLIAEARKDAWHTIRNLCRSHNGHTAVVILLDILRHPAIPLGSAPNIREMRGSISVLEKIIGKHGANSFPTVPFALLMDALIGAISTENPRVESEILRLILSLISGDKAGFSDDIMQEDWTKMFDIVKRCSVSLSKRLELNPLTGQTRALSPAPSDTSGDSNQITPAGMSAMLQKFVMKIEKVVVGMGSTSDFMQKESCIDFFAHVHNRVPESCCRLVIEYYADYRLCYPSDPNWKANIELLQEAFFSNRSRSTQIRLLALKAITDVYEMVELVDDHQDQVATLKIVSGILESITEEIDVIVLKDVVSFAVSVADTAEPALFEYITKKLHQGISSDQLNSPISSPASRIGLTGPLPSSSTTETRTPPVTPAGVVTRGFVQMFMRSMDKSSSKALRIFDELLWIAKSNACDADARLRALRILFRLRADWANRIFLTPFMESEGLASSLYRTHASQLKKQAADDASQTRASRLDDGGGLRPIRTTASSQLTANMSTPILRNVTSASRIIPRSQPLWIHPDPDALPEPASGKASIFLVSVIDDEGKPDESIHANRKALKIGVWLETVMGLMQQGCDWEIYSYILVHLPSQLTNQALFRGAISQVKQLRALICQQIKLSSFHEPPTVSGLRKADVAICLFHALNMVMSYHQHFQRSEEDEIVKTFIQGMNAWERAAKCCIHALTICCHELPASMKLVLASILEKMSRIITQSHVAVHILEFLACLARLPKLHSNFRDDDYRVVFGICFQYLRYVREKSQAQESKPPSRHSSAHARHHPGSIDSTKSLTSSNSVETVLLPNTSDDLPQYVYSLAYNDITFWFLSLRLSERGNQVSWIMRNLVWTDDLGRQQIDEQAQVTMNFMRRTAYADVDESAADPTFTEDRYGEILKRRWLVGQSIVTIEQATRGGRARITKRQPSGTSHYMVCEHFERPPAHQVKNSPEAIRDSGEKDPNVVQPSHLLVQLAAPSELTNETLRPVPLPNDDMMRRSIAVFDRIPTVDCHKVGVIYVGENQTLETEILANRMGSSDYTDFLSRLGTLTKLQGATFNTQGLDKQYNTDGEYTFCWRDRVTEMVFHVTTLMPTNLEHDPQCANKKRHIGNDYVNIIFNNSGHPFRFDTFPSQFNYVNIVITPESRASFVATRLRTGKDAVAAFYGVQVMSKQGFPEISPAAETKIVSLKALPDFIRLLALNASMFSLVWANREGGEHVSSWRSRLREIERLRRNYGPKPTVQSTPALPTNVGLGNGSGSGMNSPDLSRGNFRDSYHSLRRSSIAPSFLTSNSEFNDRSSKHLSTADTEIGTFTTDESMVDSLDFSKWA